MISNAVPLRHNILHRRRELRYFLLNLSRRKEPAELESVNDDDYKSKKEPLKEYSTFNSNGA
jgi:hypothetical protein